MFFISIFFMLFLFFLLVFFLFLENFKINFYLLESKLMSFEFFTDFYSKMFIMAVLFITFVIFMYNKYYMLSENFMKRFLFLVLWFVMSMMLLLMGNNFFSLFIGWDGLGVSSYFLVIFYQNWKSLNAGLITVLSNRVGDCLFMLFLVYMMFNFDKLSSMTFMMKMFMFIFLFLCLTKSAQFPFSTWLPLAMAAPTPVSSLVHSSTLVTAGFYLLFRYSNFNSLYHLNSFVLVFCLLTLFYSGVNGLLEMDFKKIIALSTLSQLSLMFISISIDMKMMSFFHLFTHSFFKSLLFVSVGIIIHQFFSNQDLRNYNTLFMNILKMSIMFSLLSLMGMLFTSGFFSKDFILEKIFLMNSSMMMVWLFFMMMFLTMFYSLRLLHTIFFLNFQQVLIYQSFSFYMMFGIFFLSFLSLVIGNFMLWNFMNLIFIYSMIKMKLFMLFMVLNSLIIFWNFKFKLFYKTNFYSSMMYLNKISIMLNNLFYFWKFPLFIFLEKSFMEIYMSNMTYKSYNIFSMSILKTKFIYILTFLIIVMLIIFY